MDKRGGLNVGAVARLSGVTVLTLYHYDEIGLLRAGTRSEAGYRRYDDADSSACSGSCSTESWGGLATYLRDAIAANATRHGA